MLYWFDSRNEQSPTFEVVHETKLTSEISFPTDSLLAQLAECGTDDLEAVGSIPGIENFFILLFFFNAGRILSRFGRKFRIMQKLEWEIPVKLYIKSHLLNSRHQVHSFGFMIL